MTNDYFHNKDIYLRALEPEDMEVLYKWENDTRIWSKGGGSIAPYSKFAIRQYIANAMQEIYEIKQLRMMVIDKTTDEAVGTVDLYDFDALNKRAGIGILIDEEHQRRGYALQGLECIERYAFTHLQLHQLYAYIASHNKASIALFEKANYINTATLRDWLVSNKSLTDVVVMQRFDK